MTDRRKLQRTLFRMQVDPAFAERVFDRDEAALASTGLVPDDVELLCRADPRAVAADPEGKRRVQVLGNAASEFTASLAAAATSEVTHDLLLGFASAPELHDALVRDSALPLAFACYAGRVAAETGDRLLAAIVRLEEALAWLRRETRADPELGPGAVGLTGRARVLTVPRGTHAATSGLRQALARNQPLERPLFALGDPMERGERGEGGESGEERLLLISAVRENPFRLPDVAVERLQPPIDELFALLAEAPRSAEERAEFAERNGAPAADLETFLDGFAAEGALVRG